MSQNGDVGTNESPLWLPAERAHVKTTSAQGYFLRLVSPDGVLEQRREKERSPGVKKSHTPRPLFTPPVRDQATISRKAALKGDGRLAEH